MTSSLPSTRIIQIGPLRVALVASTEGDSKAASEVVEDLVGDFALFTRGLIPGDFTDFQVKMILECRNLENPESVQREGGVRVFKFRDAACFGAGPHRVVVYDDGAVVDAEHQSGQVRVWAAEKARLYEIAYLFLLSKAGETFDSLGLHRVHGLGVSIPALKKTALFVMDSGVGKSTLALALGRYFKVSPIGFFSDEIPLLDGRLIFPFPIRVALSTQTQAVLPVPESDLKGIRKFKRKAYPEKSLISLNTLGKVASEASLRSIFICNRLGSAQVPRIQEASRLKVFREMFKSCVVGVGVPQMTEHLLRLNLKHLLMLAQMAISRFVTVLRFSLSCDCLEFTMAQNPEANVRALEKWSMDQ